MNAPATLLALAEDSGRGMLSPGQLIERARRIEHVEVLTCDRHEMAIGLFLQGYTAGRACHLAFVELEDNDGALQMLARHRLAATQPVSGAEGE